MGILGLKFHKEYLKLESILDQLAVLKSIQLVLKARCSVLATFCQHLVNAFSWALHFFEKKKFNKTFYVFEKNTKNIPWSKIHVV